MSLAGGCRRHRLLSIVEARVGFRVFAASFRKSLQYSQRQTCKDFETHTLPGMELVEGRQPAIGRDINFQAMGIASWPKPLWSISRRNLRPRYCPSHGASPVTALSSAGAISRSIPGHRSSRHSSPSIMHESEPLDLICRLPEGRRTKKYPVAAGHFHLSPAGRAAHVGWTADKQSFVIAMENSFIERTIGNAFDGCVPEIRGRAALRDPAVEKLIACLRRSLIDNSRCGGLCLDLVGTSLALRLFETYGENSKPPPSIRGGLGASRRRRIVCRTVRRSRTLRSPLAFPATAISRTCSAR